MLYKKSLIYQRTAAAYSNADKAKASKKTSEFKQAAKNIIDSTKEKLNETFSEENIEKAKEKATEFGEEAKAAIEDISEKGTELAGEAAEHLVDLAEDAKEEVKEASSKVKTFFKNIGGNKKTEN